jgi:hypothetical protein
MEKQLELLRKAGTWELCIRSDVPVHHRILKGRWVYTVKRNGLYKARWVVKGYEQVKSIDFQKTFAAVAKTDIYRLLLALAVMLDWEIHSWDIDNAFLYRDIDGDIYIELPQGFGEGNSESVGKLLKSLYSLK